MKVRTIQLYAALAFAIGQTALSAADRVVFDVAPPDKRKATLEVASRLSKQRPLIPMPAGAINPFDPSGFGQPDADERAAELAAAKSAQQSNIVKAPNDRELLETIASKIGSTGTMFIGGEPTLVLGKKAVKIGTKFTV